MHQDYDPTCRKDTDVTVLSARLQTLHADVSDIKGTLKDLTMAINKLALVEERLGNTNAAQERTFKMLSKMDERIDALEKQAVSSNSAVKWVDRGITAIVGAALMFVWDKITKGH